MAQIINSTIGQTIYGLPTNTTFVDVFRVRESETYADSAAKFVAEYKASGLYASNNKISDTSASVLFYLLYAKYGNSSLQSTDVNRFKYALWMTIYEYGPAWESRVDIQSKVRALTDAELTTGSQALYNHAFNPGTAPSTAELTAINEQNVTKYSKSKIEAYGLKWEMVATDVTADFISKFAKLFRIVAAPLYQLGFAVEE